MISVIMAMLAATTVYRLELTDEVPYIVGADGVKRQVVIVDPDEYSVITQRVDLAWKTLNSTTDGRKKIHGSIVNTSIEGMWKIVTYADGYTHRERMETRKGEALDQFKMREKRPTKRFYTNMSDRQKAFLEKCDEAKSSAPKSVTIEHDAATGKDIVK